MENSKFNTRCEKWTFAKLSKLKPVNINRDTEIRLSKVTKRLQKKYLPTHSVIYVALITKAFGPYRKGEYCRLDGNTRFDVYSVKPELIPTTPFMVIIFDIDNEKDLKDTYYSIDSQDAVESSSDKMTGLLRFKNYTPKSKLFKEGKFKRGLDVACKYGNDKEGTYLQTASTEIQINHYWKEVMFLDKIGLDNKHSRYSPNVLGCLLMIGKKYGVNHKRYSLLVENYKNGFTTRNDSKFVDGVHYVYNNLYEKNESIWKLSTWGMANKIVGPILYCFDKFMLNENLSKSTKFPTSRVTSDFFQFYNERN